MRMNIIKKYWDSVYIYVLLFIPCSCMCAGILWSGLKLSGLYSNLSWVTLGCFDFSQIIYLMIALFFIFQNRRDSSYIMKHLVHVKMYIVIALFIQYNFIMYLFPSTHVWSCTYIFFALIAFLFDFRLLAINVFAYIVALLTAHLLQPAQFLPLDAHNLREVIAFRISVFILTTLFILIIVYFVERFLIQARENDEENIRLLEKQLEYYRNTELMDNDLRKFRHDIKNHFLCMEYFINNGNKEDLQKYFADLKLDFPFHEKIYHSGNDIVDSILHHDLSRYCDENVHISVYGEMPKLEKVSDMDLCTLFSNLLSNSIASVNRCVTQTEAQLVIQFNTGKKYCSITISNSIHSDMELKHIKKKAIKHDRNHGHGTYKIREVLDKYNGKLEQCNEDHLVTMTAYLPL